MAASGQMPERLPESAIAIQIDTTTYRSEIRFSHGLQRFGPSFNRTLLQDHIFWIETGFLYKRGETNPALI
jgi:hypothetical protein